MLGFHGWGNIDHTKRFKSVSFDTYTNENKDKSKQREHMLQYTDSVENYLTEDELKRSKVKER